MPKDEGETPPLWEAGLLQRAGVCVCLSPRSAAAPFRLAQGLNYPFLARLKLEPKRANGIGGSAAVICLCLILTLFFRTGRSLRAVLCCAACLLLEIRILEIQSKFRKIHTWLSLIEAGPWRSPADPALILPQTLLTDTCSSRRQSSSAILDRFVLHSHARQSLSPLANQASFFDRKSSDHRKGKREIVLQFELGMTIPSLRTPHAALS